MLNSLGIILPVACGSLLALGGGASCDPTPEDLHQHFRDREQEGFCGVILLARDGKVVLERAYGHRDPNTDSPMRTSDVFDIGSIVKPLTAAAIYKLEAEGTLSTTDTLNKYFEDVPDDKRAITIDHLLRHRSGLQDAFGGDYDLVTRDELLRIAMESSLIAAVDERQQYSNTGYAILAMIVEDVSGLPFEEYIHESLLTPAGTPRIGYTFPAWTRDELTVGMRAGERFGTPLEHAWFGDGPSWHLRGNGGMLANARELVRFFPALEQDDRVLPPAARDRWLAHYATELENGDRVYGALGGNSYFNAVVLRNLDTDVTFVGLSNIGEHDVEASLNVILKHLKHRIRH